MAIRERIYLTKQELEARELQILNDRHIERYAMIRQWCHGRVVDYGCGCGYGSYMISRNPDVHSVIGVDRDEEAIAYATEHFSSDSVSFSKFAVECDTLVALEVMEHIKDEHTLPTIAAFSKASDIIVSYPSKKTTHYNKHHFHDFKKSDMYRLWEEDTDKMFSIVEFIELYREHMIVRIKRSV